MRIRVIALGLACAACLCGQHRFSWQDACFKNPTLPYCIGHEGAVRKTPPARDPEARRAFKGLLPLTSGKAAATGTVIDGVDWRFADPDADALVGFSGSRLSASPLARGLIARLGADQGLTAADTQKIFDRLSAVDHVALSVHGNRILVMLTGRAADSILPALEPGWKAVPVAGNAMVMGPAAEVDQAVQRLADDDDPAELAYLAAALQPNSEFWAAGSAALGGPQSASAGVRGFSLTVTARDRFASDAAFIFEGVPDANTLQTLLTALGTVTVEGNVIHAKTSLEVAEVQQGFGQIAASPLGQRLAALVQVARYLPARESTAVVHTKPVIFGLDDGPKELGRSPSR